MAGYFGTEQQRTLQAKAEAALNWMKETPGACNPARLLGSDDPDLLGWGSILEILARDGLFAFRMIPTEVAEHAAEKLAAHGYRIDLWDVFRADRPTAERAAFAILAKALPTGFQEMPALDSAEHAGTRELQEFVAANGIAPFSGSMLMGEFGPAVTVRIADAAGKLAATAHAYFPHNMHSPHHLSAWGGMAVVSPDHRGAGLGKYVNARMVANCFSHLGAETIHEFVSATNLPSRKMVEASGLRLDPALKCAVASAGGERYTR